MYRLFTFEEATDMIPTVDGLLGELQDAANELDRLREGMSRLSPNSIVARNTGQEIAYLLGRFQADKAQLDRLGVHLKDVESGLVDFPSQLGAEVICLSWEKGQAAITHYHRLGERVAKPLPDSLANGGGAVGA